jgi:hypothetical protein
MRANLTHRLSGSTTKLPEVFRPKWEDTAVRGDTSAPILALAMAVLAVTSAKADGRMSSSPPDYKSYSRALISEDFDRLNAGSKLKPGQFDVFVVDAVVNNSDPNLKITDRTTDSEISIAINPSRPNEGRDHRWFRRLGFLRAALAVKKRRQHLVQRVYNQPATGSTPGLPV